MSPHKEPYENSPTSIRIPESQLARIGKLTARKVYSSRSQFILKAISEKLAGEIID